MIWKMAAAIGCAMGVASSALAQVMAPEVKVGSNGIVDFEFDWGRDGIYCAACNSGAGNARLTFVDSQYNLWVANIDPDTGVFVPQNGQGTLVDVDAAQVTDFGNGPEWVGTAAGSQITYVKHQPGADKSAANAAIAIASFDGTVWSGNFIVNGSRRVLPFGSLEVDDPNPLLAYQSNSNRKTYVRFLNDPASETVVPDAQICSRRWVTGAQALVYASPCLRRSSATTPSQVHWYDVATQTSQQVSNDASQKSYAFAWRAPELNNDFVLLTIGDQTTILLYRRTVDADGVASWSLYNTIAMPPETPYATSPDPFVHNGKSYIVVLASPSPSGTNLRAATQIVLTGIDPEVPSVQTLTNNDDGFRVRSDPEYYITNQGPFVYYNRYLPASTPRGNLVAEGIWRVDTGLGPPVPPTDGEIMRRRR